MTDDSGMDYNFIYDDNITDFYFHAYDHPFWRKHELDASTRLLPRNTTLAPKPDILELNTHRCLVFSPLFIILACIMVSGAFCNIAVCYIYRCRSRRAASNFFVIFFAVFDLFGCLVVIPLEVSSLTLPLMYKVVSLCKVMECVKSWLMCCQCLTLLCVAFDCYRKMCHSERDFSVWKAKVCCFVAVVFAVILSLPASVVFTAKPLRTPYTEHFGVGCLVDSSGVEWLRFLYCICVLGTFIVSVSAMAGLYSLIYVSSYKQQQADDTGKKASPLKREFPKKHRFVRQDTGTPCITNYSEEIYRLHDIHRGLHCAFLSQSDHVHRISCKRQSRTNNMSNGEMKTSFQSSHKNKSSGTMCSAAAQTGKDGNSGNQSNNQSNSVNTPGNQNNSVNKTSNQSNRRKRSRNQSNREIKIFGISSNGIKHNSQISEGNETNDQNKIGGNTNKSAGQGDVTSVALYIKNKEYVLMFTVISVLTAINILPFVVVTILYSVTSAFNSFSSNTSEIMFHLCSRLYLLNCLVKPLTYMILHRNFRKQTRHTFNNFKMSLLHRDVTSCKKLQRLSVVGPLRSTLESTVYRPTRSMS
ncbi:unnamed protein product [Candidula unifasciata]|uniref:G-protein coupled receptors family 1 profile domain-containing protein n=1 Tax=Candidula unifasciata TaxID=100452 RepID=A0A8S3ZJJ7_9EUPU|nr:unnamed protein product [Candidula unifasciata]